MTSELCVECQEIFRHWCERKHWDKRRPDHLHHNICDLEGSAKRGCFVCSLFLDNLGADKITKIQSSDAKKRSLVRVDPDFRESDYRLYLEFRDPDGSMVEAEIEVTRASVNDPTTQMGQIADTTNCDANWRLVQKWLRNCLGSHSQCTQCILPRKLPTRLIRVGVTDLDIRLCLSGNLPVEVKYLTLSHCWGKIPYKILTRQNLDSMLSNIPTDKLAKTFQDAIEITRHLGFQYLWIDSLCILQDDLTDWQHESAVMGSIYANSSLNIAAADAPDGNTGCFFDRDPNIQYGYKVSVLAERDDMSESIWACLPKYFSLTNLADNALGSRAWAFQERLLAPRSLYFNRTQLFWECREVQACEIFPDTYRNAILTTPGICMNLASKNALKRVQSWNDLLVEYSGRKLTFSKDKLAAISGVAQLYSSNIEVSYLAGLWSHDLELQLPWYVSPQSAVKHPEEYRAPSWSWASVDGQAWIPLPLFEYSIDFHLDVAEAYVKLSTDDPFGQVSDGYLRVKCHAPLAYGRAVIDNYIINLSEKIDVKASVYPDTNPHSLGVSLIYMPVFTSDELGTKDMRGIVLEPIDHGCFRRVGAFHIWDEHIDKFQKYQAESRVREEDIPGVQVSTDETGKTFYTLTIK